MNNVQNVYIATFALKIFRMMMIFVADFHFIMKQLNVVNVFLNVFIDEKIYCHILLLLLKSYSIWHRLYDDLCERIIDDYRKKLSIKIKIFFCMLVHVSILRWLNLCAESSRDEVVIIIFCHCVYWIYEIALRHKLLDQLRHQRELF
jgi:hypothetical protein